MTKEEVLQRIIGQRIVTIKSAKWDDESDWLDGTFVLENGLTITPLDLVKIHISDDPRVVETELLTVTVIWHRLPVPYVDTHLVSVYSAEGKPLCSNMKVSRFLQDVYKEWTVTELIEGIERAYSSRWRECKVFSLSFVGEETGSGKEENHDPQN